MLYTTSLKLNKEFRRLYYKGKFKAGKHLVTYMIKRRDNQCRIGITASKKIGNAVQRNRARRIILAAYRELEQQVDLRGHDFVFVARKGCADQTSTAIGVQMKKQLDFLLR